MSRQQPGEKMLCLRIPQNVKSCPSFWQRRFRLVLSVFQDDLDCAIGARSKENGCGQVDAYFLIRWYGSDRQDITGIVTVDMQEFSFRIIGDHHIIEEKIAGISKDKRHVGVIHTLDPEQRTLLFIRHDDKAA